MIFQIFVTVSYVFRLLWDGQWMEFIKAKTKVKSPEHSYFINVLFRKIDCCIIMRETRQLHCCAHWWVVGRGPSNPTGAVSQPVAQ